MPKTAIFLSLILILVTNYFFSLLGYMKFFNFYATSDPNQHGNLQTTCDTMLFCMFVSFDQNFKSTGGLGGWMDGNFGNKVINNDYEITDPPPFKYNSYNFGRFFFDNTYNIFINIIFMQIFSGIIINTFG